MSCLRGASHTRSGRDRVLGNHEEAEVAVQNCLRAAASNNVSKFEDEGAFRSWLIRLLIDEAVIAAKDLRPWLADTGAKTLYIEPGSPGENGYCESFNSKRRDEFFNGEIFYSTTELRVLAERWRITTAPSGHTPRWDINHLHRKPA
jgi:transposase InsO family protein